MAQNDFLLVVTPDWIEMPESFIDVVLHYSEQGFIDLIQREDWGQLNEYVELSGLLPVGETLAIMRLVAIGTDPNPYARIRVWCKYKPLIYT
jgi:hypothetical protein